MSLFIYNLSILLFRIGIGIGSIFNKKAALFLKGRRDQFSKMEGDLRDVSSIIWFHCASLGEFEQGRPVIEACRSQYPHHQILITFFSPSGYEVRKNYEGADFVYYLPVDTHHNAKRFLALVKPVFAVFVKYEFWFHYFSQMQKCNIPVVSISAVFRPDQIYFKWYGQFNVGILKCATHIFTQDNSSLKLLKGIGIEEVTISGDTRFDRVAKIRRDDSIDPLVDEFCGDSKILIVGSSWPEDHSLLLPFVNKKPAGMKFIIAPHEIIESQISQLEKSLNMEGCRYSEADLTTVHQGSYLIIDSIGILSQIYKYGHFAYIGGAFGAGLHNILEAAVFGLPLFFGDRNYLKFREANELIELGGAIPVATSEEFEESLVALLDEDLREDTSLKIVKYMERNTGATEIIMNYINERLS